MGDSVLDRYFVGKHHKFAFQNKCTYVKLKRDTFTEISMNWHTYILIFSVRHYVLLYLKVSWKMKVHLLYSNIIKIGCMYVSLAVVYPLILRLPLNWFRYFSGYFILVPGRFLSILKENKSTFLQINDLCKYPHLITKILNLIFLNYATCG